MADTTTHASWRRTVGFAGAVFAFVTVMLGTTLPTPMYSTYAAKLHFSILTTTVIFATYAGGVIAALLAFGRWSDTLGRRPLLFAALTFGILSSAVFLTAGPIPQLLAGRLLSGLSAGIVTGTATAAVIEAAPEAWRTRAPTVATIANMGGLGLGPLLAGVLVEFAPWPLQLSFAVHIGLLLISAVGVAVMFESVDVKPGARPKAQRLAVPAEIRALFVRAAVAAFAGFAVLGLFTAVAPSFLAGVLGVQSHAAAGLLVFTIFAASAVGQIAARRLSTSAALVGGCAALVAGMVLIALALHFSSTVALVMGALLAGIGQGASFSKGLGAVAEATPVQRRAEVSSTFFVVAYVAISIPVIGEGLAARAWGLRTAGTTFAIAVAVLAAAAMVASIVAARRADTGR